MSLLAGVLSASAPASSAPEDQRIQRARQELDRDLKKLVDIPAPAVELVFKGLEEPGFRLLEAQFLLDGRQVLTPAAAQLDKPGEHALYAGPVDHGSHTLIARLVYEDVSSVVFSSEAGYRWKVGSTFTFPAQRGLELKVVTLAELVPGAKEVKDRIKLTSSTSARILARLEDGQMPPPPKPNLPPPPGVDPAAQAREAAAAQKAAGEEEARQAREAAAAQKAAGEEEARQAKQAAAVQKAAQEEEARQAKRVAAAQKAARREEARQAKQVAAAQKAARKEEARQAREIAAAEKAARKEEARQAKDPAPAQNGALEQEARHAREDAGAQTGAPEPRPALEIAPTVAPKPRDAGDSRLGAAQPKQGPDRAAVRARRRLLRWLALGLLALGAAFTTGYLLSRRS